MKYLLYILLLVLVAGIAWSQGIKEGKRQISEQLENAIVSNKNIKVEGFYITHSVKSEAEIWVENPRWHRASIKKTGGR